MSIFFDYVTRIFNRLRTLFINFYHWLEIDELTGMLVLGVIMGIIGGFVSVGFRYYISFCQSIFWQFTATGAVTLRYLENLSWYQLLITPALGGLIIGPVVYWLSVTVSGSGIPEVLQSIVTKRGRIDPRLTVLKPLLSGITIGSGGSAGREGPIVETGAAAGSSIGQFLKLRQKKVQTLVGCGASAGIAGTFHAPLGGVMFSLEILLEEFQISQFSPIVVASVVSTAITQAFLGTTPYFHIPEYVARSHWELTGYFLLGLLAGVVGYLFTETLYSLESSFEQLAVPAYVKPALGGLGLGLLGIFLPQIFGVGYETIESVINDNFTVWLLLFLMAGKILGTGLTLGSGNSGGIFAPSLFIGAMLGSAYGNIIANFADSIPLIKSASASSYSLVGMGALVSATTHAPLTAILLLFEMTRNYLIIIPLLISCMVSYYLSYRLDETNIYTRKLTNQGISILAGKETNLLQSIPAKEAMVTDVKYLEESAGLDKIRKLFEETHHTHYPVVDEERKVIGLVDYVENWDLLTENQSYNVLVARDLARTPAVTIKKNDNLLEALRKITDLHVELLPVVNDNGHLEGVLSRNDIINTYNQKLRESR